LQSGGYAAAEFCRVVEIVGKYDRIAFEFRPVGRRAEIRQLFDFQICPHHLLHPDGPDDRIDPILPGRHVGAIRRIQLLQGFNNSELTLVFSVPRCRACKCPIRERAFAEAFASKIEGPFGQVVVLGYIEVEIEPDRGMLENWVVRMFGDELLEALLGLAAYSLHDIGGRNPRHVVGYRVHRASCNNGGGEKKAAAENRSKTRTTTHDNTRNALNELTAN